MSGYTPTTEEVRATYTREEPPRGLTVTERRAEFDRWVAAHDAELRAEIAAAIRAYGDINPDAYMNVGFMAGKCATIAEGAS